ncbi:MAG: DUF3488 and DUF4129 domain-containing transglutaminase family protein [Pirellulales bacterium]
MNPSAARLERWLQISMAVFVWLGTLMLGMGEESFVIPIVSLMACAGSVYLTDIRGWLRLNNRQANLAGLATVAVCFWELRQVDVEVQVLALANLLFYLQCVNLFRQKEPRIYWMLALLSVLEVAVAAVLNDNLMFAGLLVTYFLVGIATLALFLLMREHNEQRPAFGGAPVMSTANLDDALSWPMARQLLRVALATLVLMGALFVITPRSESGPWGQIIESTSRSVGYEGTRIQLGDTDEVTEDASEVMRVRLFHHDTRAEFKLTGPLLLRGAVLTDYEVDAGDATWAAAQRGGERRSVPEATRADLAGQVEQEYILKPSEDDTLFAVFPFAKVSSSNTIMYDTRRERLFRTFRGMNSEYRYNLVSPSLKDGKQARLVPHEGRVNLYLSQLEPSQQTSLAGLIAAAENVVKDIPPSEHESRCLALESYLRDSGQFTYSLVPSSRDPQLDPVEHFVTNSKAGHCEYFASALALMLRSQGIPARIAMGFKTSDYNTLGHFYQIRQLHAHSWVEAYLEDKKGWLRLDPTPAGDDTANKVAQQRKLPTLREIADFVKYLWSGYVVGLTAEKQRQDIYKPVAAFVGGIFSPRSWRTFAKDLRAVLFGPGDEPLDEDSGEEPSTGGIVLLLASLLAVAIYRGVKRLVRVRWPSRKTAASKKVFRRRRELVSPVVLFYRRFEQVLAKRKLVRATGQTQREFARDIGGRLADTTDSRAAAAPRMVTDAFYRVRFGGQALDNAELDGVEKALQTLEAALAPAKKRKSSV